MNDCDEHLSGLLAGHIAAVHSDMTQIPEEVVPDGPYDQVSIHVSAPLMPGGRDGTIRFLSFGRWWR